jgi:hypothetical protein
MSFTERRSVLARFTFLALRRTMCRLKYLLYALLPWPFLLLVLLMDWRRRRLDSEFLILLRLSEM